jgi:Uma2 family endonuclease
MRQVTGKPALASGLGEPAWEIAQLFPVQGQWSEGEYLALDGNHLLELSRGVLEVLPMPTTSHQYVTLYLYRLLLAFAAAHQLGEVLSAPIRVQLWRGTFREPDVVFMLAAHINRIGEDYWKRADLVMEVVSGGREDRRRDLVLKRREYAQARIPEYWIVDPHEERITVLRLAVKRYVVHGEFSKGTLATSYLLPGFEVNVTEALSQGIRGATTKAARKRKRS